MINVVTLNFVWLPTLDVHLDILLSNNVLIFWQYILLKITRYIFCTSLISSIIWGLGYVRCRFFCFSSITVPFANVWLQVFLLEVASSTASIFQQLICCLPCFFIAILMIFFVAPIWWTLLKNLVWIFKIILVSWISNTCSQNFLEKIKAKSFYVY